MPLILASASETRSRLLANAGVAHDTMPPRVDEAPIKAAMLEDGASHRDIADALAEAKASKVSGKAPGRIVIGCDQVLSHDGRLVSKAGSREDAAAELRRLRGARHELLTAAVACRDGEPLWRHVAVVRLSMRAFSDAYLEDYLDRNWESLRHSVGGYRLEEEGLRLLRSVEGDYFATLGLPMIPLLSWLGDAGHLPA